MLEPMSVIRGFRAAGVGLTLLSVVGVGATMVAKAGVTTEATVACRVQQALSSGEGFALPVFSAGGTAIVRTSVGSGAAAANCVEPAAPMPLAPVSAVESVVGTATMDLNKIPHCAVK